jgi:hypothetical protein
MRNGGTERGRSIRNKKKEKQKKATREEEIKEKARNM